MSKALPSFVCIVNKLSYNHVTVIAAAFLRGLQKKMKPRWGIYAHCNINKKRQSHR